MSSAYSSPANFGKNISVLDIINLTGSVQGALQKNYDANVAKVDSLIQQYTSVPLVRAVDKAYLGERLQTLLSSVDQNSKINWTSGTAARDVNAHIAAAIDDNVLKQMSNSQAIINFEQTAAQKKAKGDGTYNDINYVYAKDKAGYQDYMSGVDKNGNKVDDIGSLQYIDYYDVNKNLTEQVEKFAKERGYEKVIDTESKDGVVFKTVKGKVLSPEEISNFVNMQIDGDVRLKQQLLINSHAEYRGASDEEVLKQYTDFANKRAGEVDEQMALIESQKKNTNKDDVAKLQQLDSTLSTLLRNKESILNKVKPENFNRDAVQFTSYSQNLVNQYAKTYAVNDITDIKYDDFYIKLAKAEGKLTEEGTPTVIGGTPAIGQAYEVERAVTPTEGAVDDLTEFETGRTKVWTDMQAQIKNKLYSEGKDTSVKSITQYYTGLREAVKNGIDINAQGYSAEEIALAKQVETYNKRGFQMTKIASDEYGRVSEDVLSGLFGGKRKDLNVEGLAQTMPHTAGLLTKYSSIDQVPKKEREMAFYEIATNAKNTLDLDEKDKKRINLYLSDLERKNSFSKEELKQNVKTEEEKGYFDSMWDVAKGALKFTTGYLLPNALSPLTTFRTEAKQQNWKEQEAALQESTSLMEAGRVGMNRAFENKFVSDRDLADIQSGDIALSDYGTPRDRFSMVSKNVREKISLQTEAYKANLPKQSALILNPEIKADKPYVELAKNALVANGANPAKDTFINITEIKDGKAYIEYNEEVLTPKEKGGQTKEIVKRVATISAANLPKNLISGLQTDLGAYEFSVKNPTPMEVKYNFSPPNDLDSRREMAQKYLENNAKYMSDTQISMLQKTGFSDVKTKEDFIKDSIDLPREYYEQFLNDINSQYSLEWERPQGGGLFKGRLMKQGKTVEENIVLGEDFNPHLYQLYSIKAINSHLDSRLQELKTSYLRTRQ